MAENNNNFKSEVVFDDLDAMETEAATQANISAQLAMKIWSVTPDDISLGLVEQPEQFVPNCGTATENESGNDSPGNASGTGSGTESGSGSGNETVSKPPANDNASIYLSEVERVLYGDTTGYPEYGSPNFFKAAENYSLFGESFLDFPKDTAICLAGLGTMANQTWHSTPVIERSAMSVPLYERRQAVETERATSGTNCLGCAYQQRQQQLQKQQQQQQQQQQHQHQQQQQHHQQNQHKQQQQQHPRQPGTDNNNNNNRNGVKNFNEIPFPQFYHQMHHQSQPQPQLNPPHNHIHLQHKTVQQQGANPTQQQQYQQQQHQQQHQHQQQNQQQQPHQQQHRQAGNLFAGDLGGLNFSNANDLALLYQQIMAGNLRTNQQQHQHQQQHRTGAVPSIGDLAGLAHANPNDIALLYRQLMAQNLRSNQQLRQQQQQPRLPRAIYGGNGGQSGGGGANTPNGKEPPAGNHK